MCISIESDDCLTCEKHVREKFMQEANKAYRKAQSNKKAWREELKERAEWDVTLADGLEDE